MAKIISVEGTDHEFPDDATEPEIQAALTAAHPKPAVNPTQGKANHPGYKSSLPYPLNRMDEVVSDGINGLSEGAMKLFGKGKTTDERLGGASEMGRSALNSMGAPFLLRGAAAAPVRMVKGLAAAAVAHPVATKTAEVLGAGPGTQQFVGDAASILAGGAGSKAPSVPVRKLYGGGKGGTKELVYNLPLVGRTIKSTVKGAQEGYRKSDPNYVDPKVAIAAERDAQALVRTRDRVRVGAEERARIAAEKAAAEAALPRAPEVFRPNSSMRAKMPNAAPSSNAGMPTSSATPRPSTPAYGPDVTLSPKTAPPVEVTPSPAPVAPTPFKPNPNILRKTRFTPSGGDPGMPSARPVSVKPRSGPALYKSNAEAAPETPAVTPRPPQLPPDTAKTVAAPSSGPSAPEGSTVIPPKPGVKYDSHDIATMDKINASRVANDAKVSAYLKSEGITKSQWDKATPEQKRTWAKGAGSKSRYDSPERIQHLAELLEDGPALYQGTK